MKDGVIADYNVTQIMLKYFIAKALGKIRFFRPEVIISVPGGITSTERRAVIEAAISAGAKNAYVIKETLAAAIGAGIPIESPTGNLIVDIGGGTTDVAVLSLGGIVASTSVRVAGNKLDVSIIDAVKSIYGLAIGERTAEEIKIQIGSAIEIEDEESLEIRGRDLLTGLPKSIYVKTNEIARIFQEDLMEIIQAIKKVLAETPPELAADIIDKGIVLTGGTSQLRNLDKIIYHYLGVRAFLAEDPLLCVAKGTGIALDNLDAYKKSILSIR